MAGNIDKPQLLASLMQFLGNGQGALPSRNGVTSMTGIKSGQEVLQWHIPSHSPFDWPS